MWHEPGEMPHLGWVAVRPFVVLTIGLIYKQSVIKRLPETLRKEALKKRARRRKRMRDFLSDPILRENILRDYTASLGSRERAEEMVKELDFKYRDDKDDTRVDENGQGNGTNSKTTSDMADDEAKKLVSRTDIHSVAFGRVLSFCAVLYFVIFYFTTMDELLAHFMLAVTEMAMIFLLLFVELQYQTKSQASARAPLAACGKKPTQEDGDDEDMIRNNGQKIEV